MKEAKAVDSPTIVHWLQLLEKPAEPINTGVFNIVV